MSNNDEVIMYSSENAAQKKTVSGWVSRNGRFFGDDEHMARFDGCTHMICSCGKVMRRGYTMCSACSMKNRDHRYMSLPYKEWDGITMLALFEDDNYFSDESEVVDYCEDHGIKIADLMLVICEPQYAREVDDDYFEDIIPDGMTISDCYPELGKALNKLNEFIRLKEKPISWIGGNFRTSLVL